MIKIDEAVYANYRREVDMRVCYLRFGWWRRVIRRVVSSNIHDLRWHEQSTRHYIHFSRVVFRESSRSGNAEWLQTDPTRKSRGRAQLPDRTIFPSSVPRYVTTLHSADNAVRYRNSSSVLWKISIGIFSCCRCRCLDDLLDFFESETHDRSRFSTRF